MSGGVPEGTCAECERPGQCAGCYLMQQAGLPLPGRVVDVSTRYAFRYPSTDPDSPRS